MANRKFAGKIYSRRTHTSFNPYSRPQGFFSNVLNCLLPTWFADLIGIKPPQTVTCQKCGRENCSFLDLGPRFLQRGNPFVPHRSNYSESQYSGVSKRFIDNAEPYQSWNSRYYGLHRIKTARLEDFAVLSFARKRFFPETFWEREMRLFHAERLYPDPWTVKRQKPIYFPRGSLLKAKYLPLKPIENTNTEKNSEKSHFPENIKAEKNSDKSHFPENIKAEKNSDKSHFPKVNNSPKNSIPWTINRRKRIYFRNDDLLNSKVPLQKYQKIDNKDAEEDFDESDFHEDYASPQNSGTDCSFPGERYFTNLPQQTFQHLPMSNMANPNFSSLSPSALMGSRSIFSAEAAAFPNPFGAFTSHSSWYSATTPQQPFQFLWSSNSHMTTNFIPRVETPMDCSETF